MILALVLITVMGSLSLMGRSTSNLLSNFQRSARNSPILEEMFKTDSGGFGLTEGQSAKGRTWAESETTNEIDKFSGRKSENWTMKSGKALTETPMFQISAGASGGVNATSLDGARREMLDSTVQTLSLTSRMQKLADDLPRGPEKLWLTYDLIPRLMSLAAAEGFSAEIPILRDGLADRNYTDKDAMRDISEIRNQLIYKSKIFSYMLEGDTVEQFAKPSPQLQQAVLAIIDEAVRGTEAFIPNPVSAKPNWNIIAMKKGYDVVETSVKAAQADGSLNQSESAANTAAGADTLKELADNP
jgi:hypothetical protein